MGLAGWAIWWVGGLVGGRVGLLDRWVEQVGGRVVWLDKWGVDKLGWGWIVWSCGWLGGWVRRDGGLGGGWGVLENFEIHVYT